MWQKLHSSALGAQGMRPRRSKVTFTVNAQKITGTNPKWQESMEAYLKLFGRFAKWRLTDVLMIWISQIVDKTTTKDLMESLKIGTEISTIICQSNFRCFFMKS